MKSKQVKQSHFPTVTKTPKVQIDLNDDQQIVFYFGTFDTLGPFDAKSNCETAVVDFSERLKLYQKMKWNEIHHHNHCGIKPVSIIEKEAQTRLEQLQLLEENIYQLNFDGKKRLWGIKSNNLFLCVWWDPEHKIYPTAPMGDDRRKFNRKKGR